MANNRKANRHRYIQRVPIFDKGKKAKDRKIIGYKLIRHLNYSCY